MTLDLRARWPAIRASLIALVIAIGLLDGCPIPTAGQTPSWAKSIVARGDGARRTLLEPFSWIGGDLDITQRWSLFNGASRDRFRLYVEGKTGAGEWLLLYRAGDAEHREYADILEYRRVRGAFSPRGQAPRGQYAEFANWMNRRVLVDHPALFAARTRMERIVIGEGAYTATGQFAFERIMSRSAR